MTPPKIPSTLLMISARCEADPHYYFFRPSTGLLIGVPIDSKSEDKGWLAIVGGRAGLGDSYKVEVETAFRELLSENDEKNTFYRDAIGTHEFKVRASVPPCRYYSLPLSAEDGRIRHLFMQSANPFVFGALEVADGQVVSSCVVASPNFAGFSQEDQLAVLEALHEDQSAVATYIRSNVIVGSGLLNT